MDINLLKSHLETVHGKLNTNLNGDSPQLSNIREGAADADATGGKKTKKVEKGSEKFVNETLDIVSSFLEGCFGDSLSEDTSDEDILEAIYELNYTCSHVNGFFNDYDEVDEDTVTEYFNSYFGHELNESVSEEDIIEAIERLNIACQEVNEYFEIDEGFFSGLGKGLVGGALAYGAYKGGKWLKKKYGERRTKQAGLEKDAAKHRSNVDAERKTKQAGLEKDAAKHRSNVEYMKDKKPGDTIRTKRPRTRSTPTDGGVEKKSTLPKLDFSDNPNKNLPKTLIKK